MQKIQHEFYNIWQKNILPTIDDVNIFQIYISHKWQTFLIISIFTTKVIFMWATFCMHVIFNVIKYTIIIIYRIGKKSCVVIVVLCFYNIDGGNIISQLLLLPWLLLVGNTQPRPETAKDLFNHRLRNNRQLLLRNLSFTVLRAKKSLSWPLL